METRKTCLEGRKKTYQTPALITYGTVWQLTQRVGRTGNNDGRKVGLRIKTHA